MALKCLKEMSARAARSISLVWVTAALLAGALPSGAAALEREYDARTLLALATGEGAGGTLVIDVREPGQLPALPEPANGVLTLSLRDTVLLALFGNRDVRVSSYLPLQAREEYRKARFIYDPALFASLQVERSRRPTQSILDTGDPLRDLLREDREIARGGIKKLFSTGMAVSLYQEINHLDSNSELIEPNPQYVTRVVAQLRQPLLRNLMDAENRTNLQIANLGVAQSNAALHRDIADTMAQILTAYWQLVYNNEVVRINREGLEMAEEVRLRETVRLRQGISKSLDVDRVAATAESRRADLFRAESQTRVAMSRLRTLLNLPELYTGGQELDIAPSDAPRQQVEVPERSSQLQRAFQLRPELELARKAMQSQRAHQELADNQRLPTLDLKASYARNGLLDTLDGGSTRYFDAISEPYDDGEDSWTVGLDFEWPLLGREAEAEYRRATFAHRQAFVDLQRVRDQVALEVNLALDELNLASDEIIAAGEAQEIAQRVVEGEGVRFKLTRISNEELLRAQEQLIRARREYQRALANYNINLVNLYRASGTLLGDLGITMLTAQE